jgi:glucokinase
MSESARLIADIGATNARFGVVTAGAWRVETLATADYQDTAALVSAACTALAVDAFADCCIAIAGPVVNGEGSITNGQLHFSASELGARLGCEVLLVNDFHAQAMALPHLTSLQQLGGSVQKSGTRVVLGPGSGLGVGVLLSLDGRWRVLPSEAGHADLAPGGMLELEVMSLLHQQFDQVCWETVLSGPGLINLYQAVSAIWGSKPEALTAEQISELGADAADPVCHQTLEMFLGWLGSAAGNLALTFCARGGVYIAGGIVPRLGEIITDSPLRRRFDERAVLGDYVRDIPLYVVTQENPGLRGALACLEFDQRSG